MSMIMCAFSAWVAYKPTAIPAVMDRNLYHGNVAMVDQAIVTNLAAYAVVVSLVYCHRSRRSHTPVDPNNSYLANLLLIMGLPRAGERVIEEIWILGADHRLTNSASALFRTASSLADPISCIISATASSYGPLHFGTAESAYRQMQRIGTPDKVGEAIAQHMAGKQHIWASDIECIRQDIIDASL